jgi:hypothetical protein
LRRRFQLLCTDHTDADDGHRIGDRDGDQRGHFANWSAYAYSDGFGDGFSIRSELQTWDLSGLALNER